MKIPLSIEDWFLGPHKAQWSQSLQFCHRENIQKTRIAGDVIIKRLIMSQVGCTLTFAWEAKFEIEAKISFRLEAWFHMIHFDAKHQKSEAKTKVK